MFNKLFKKIDKTKEYIEHCLSVALKEVANCKELDDAQQIIINTAIIAGINSATNGTVCLKSEQINCISKCAVDAINKIELNMAKELDK